MILKDPGIVDIATNTTKETNNTQQDRQTKENCRRLRHHQSNHAKIRRRGP